MIHHQIHEEFLSNKNLFSTSSSEKSDNNKITLPVASAFLKRSGPYVKSWGEGKPPRIIVQPNLEKREDHWKWNLFDTIVVFTQVADLGGSILATPSDHGWIRKRAFATVWPLVSAPNT